MVGSGTLVHFVGGSYSGRSLWLHLPEINFRVYKLYPTVLDNQAYGIPTVWEVDKLGYAEVMSLDTLSKSPYDTLNLMIEAGKRKITQASMDLDSLLLPLTIKSIIEDVELTERFFVKTIRISALSVHSG